LNYYQELFFFKGNNSFHIFRLISSNDSVFGYISLFWCRFIQSLTSYLQLMANVYGGHICKSYWKIIAFVSINFCQKCFFSVPTHLNAYISRYSIYRSRFFFKLLKIFCIQSKQIIRKSYNGGKIIMVIWETKWFNLIIF
jgi:hypothetical protein